MTPAAPFAPAGVTISFFIPGIRSMRAGIGPRGRSVHARATNHPPTPPVTLKLDIVQLDGRDGDTHDNLQRAIHDHRRDQRVHVAGARIERADGRRELPIP